MEISSEELKRTSKATKRTIRIQRSFAQRHDEHNLDIKLLFQGKGERNFCALSAYFFFPRSFHIREDGKSAWLKAIQSRVRFSLPRDEEDLAQSLYHNIVELEFLINLANEQKMTPEIESEGLRLVKAIGCVVGERLKSFLRDVQDDLEFVLTDEDRGEFLSDLKKNIRVKEELIRKTICLFSLDSKKHFPLLETVRDFIYFRWLETKLEVMALLDLMGYTDLNRQDFFADNPGFEGVCKQDNESHYLYLSHLKKFFQSDMFVETKQHDNIKRLSEPLAGIAAALAAFSVGYFESITHHVWQAGGILIIAIGAIMYAFKDRAKDKFRSFLHNVVGQKVADFRHYLKAKGRSIGVFHEWLRIQPASTANEKIRALRSMHMQSLIEPYIEEDVLHLRKEIRLFTEDLSTQHLALYDTIRVNFNRVLKYLDDPEKSLVELSSTGELNRVAAHRIYCATLIVQETVGSRPKTFWQKNVLRRQVQIQGERFTSYRLVFDKRGLLRVTTL